MKNSSSDDILLMNVKNSKFTGWSLVEIDIIELDWVLNFVRWGLRVRVLMPYIVLVYIWAVFITINQSKKNQSININPADASGIASPQYFIIDGY